MPNFCESRLCISGCSEQILKLESERFSKIEASDKEFEAREPFLDFDKIVTMPKNLDIICGGHSDFAHTMLYPEEGAQEKSFEDTVKTLSSHPFFLTGNPQNLAEAVQGLRQTVEGRKLLLTGHLIERNLKQYGHQDWYSWRIEHWGTKWNCCDFNYNQIGEYFFTTAWSPPIPVIESLSSLYPELTFNLIYLELGCDFAGEISWQSGYKIQEWLDLDVQSTAIDVFGYDEDFFENDKE